jgi:hypothetical protein
VRREACKVGSFAPPFFSSERETNSETNKNIYTSL